MITTDVVVIDSGINTKFIKCSNRKINGISIFRQGLSYCYNNDINDTYGHGTAVVNIITKSIQKLMCLLLKFLKMEI